MKWTEHKILSQIHRGLSDDNPFIFMTSFNKLKEIDTSDITSFSGIFEQTDITTIPLFNTSNCKNMYSMFSRCKLLKNIPLLDTSNVSCAAFMFHQCTSLTSIPLLNTLNIKDMDYMFNQCTSLTTIPSLNTSNTTNMGHMFSECYNLKTIPFLDTSNATVMSHMFQECYSLSGIIKLSLKHIDDIVMLYQMFASCNNIDQVIFTDSKFSKEELSNSIYLLINKIKITN